MKNPRLKLPDGTKLGRHFSQHVWDALEHLHWARMLPKLRRGFMRFRASDGGIHDVPARYISDALGIDQRWCYSTGQALNFRIIENAALRRFDGAILRQFYQVVAAGSKQRPRFEPKAATATHITLADGTKLSADFSKKVWIAQKRQDCPRKHDKEILRTFTRLMMAAQNLS